MKKNKPITIIILLLTLLMAMGIVSGCGNDSEINSNVYGGDVAEESVTTYEIVAPEAFHIKSSESSYDFASKISATDELGNSYDVEVDSSDVKFGTKGTYSVVVFCESNSKDIPVYIYDMPIFTQSTSALTMTYKDALTNVFASITAVDSFLNELEIVMIDDGGLYASDYTPNVGTFSIICGAIDNAGNIAYKEISMTIETSGTSVTAPAEITIDCIDETSQFSFSGGDIVSLSIDGTIVEQSEYSYDGSIITFDILYVVNNFGLGQKSLRITTVNGYVDSVLNITDDYDPAISTFGLDNWVFEVNVSSTLPTAERLNVNQQYDITYAIEDSYGNSVDIVDGSFVPTTTGVYTYTITTTKLSGTQSVKEFNVIVLSSQEYSNTIDVASSNQFIDTRFSVPSNNDSNFSFEFTDETIGSEAGSYKLSAGTLGNWYNRVEIDSSYVASSPIANSSFMVIDVYFTAYTDIYVWQNVAATYGTQNVGVKLYEKDTETQILFTSLSSNLNKWIELRIDVSSYDLTAGTQRLAIAPSASNCTLYMKNFIWA